MRDSDPSQKQGFYDRAVELCCPKSTVLWPEALSPSPFIFRDRCEGPYMTFHSFSLSSAEKKEMPWEKSYFPFGLAWCIVEF